MGDALFPSPGLLVLGAGAAAALLATAAVSAVLAVVVGAGGCTVQAARPAPGRAAATIPGRYLRLYRQAGSEFAVPWTVLAGIGAIESDHGRSGAPGVHTGLNAYGCCAGPMQFNLTDGPPSTWNRYGIDGDHDGREDPYDPADAIPAAGRYLRALLDANANDLREALLGYNHSPAYVTDVLARARAYADARHDSAAPSSTVTEASLAACADGLVAARPAALQRAVVLTTPRAYRPLPNGRSPDPPTPDRSTRGCTPT